jgi:AcrR family transcriptional regulator
MSRAKYHSERRQEQAQATRQAIIEAARALFVEHGYAGTTVADIAAAARVAVPTVYVSVGPKPAILGELRKQIPVLAGLPDAETDLAEVTDPRALVSGVTAVIRRLMETSGDLLSSIEAAAPFEPVAAEAWEEGMVLHRAGWERAAEGLEALGAIKPSLPLARAADILSLLSLPWVWRTLNRGYGWTYDEIEAWIVETGVAQVVDPGPPPQMTGRRAVEKRNARPSTFK